MAFEKGSEEHQLLESVETIIIEHYALLEALEEKGVEVKQDVLAYLDKTRGKFEEQFNAGTLAPEFYEIVKAVRGEELKRG